MPFLTHPLPLTLMFAPPFPANLLPDRRPFGIFQVRTAEHIRSNYVEHPSANTTATGTLRRTRATEEMLHTILRHWKSRVLCFPTELLGHFSTTLRTAAAT